MRSRLFTRILSLPTTIACSISLAFGCGAPQTVAVTPPQPLDEIVQFRPAPDIDAPAVDSAELTLDQLLTFADAHAPAVLAARAQTRVADAELVGAQIRVSENPEVTVAGGGRSVGGRTGFEFEVAVEQRLEVFREPTFRLAEAEAQRALAEAVVDEVRWAVHVEVHRLFVDLLVIEERRQQAAGFVEFAESLLLIAERQVEAGEAAPLILLVARADVEQAREAQISANETDAALRSRLAAVAGWPGAIPELVGTVPEVVRAPGLDGLTERMLVRHPTLRRHDAAIAAARANLALQDREARPEPLVGLSYGREAAPGPEPEANVWMFSVGVPLPIWRTNRAGRARAEAELDAAGIDLSAAERTLRGELEQAVIALDAAADRVALYESGVVPNLEANLELLRRAYELGEVDIHVLSQTRERLLEATAAFVDARIVYFESVAVLEGLVGDDPWLNDGSGQ